MKLTYVHIQPASPNVNKRAEVSYTRDVENKGLQNCGATNLNSVPHYVSFCGGGIKPTPCLKSTYAEIKSFYHDYKESLGEVSLKDIVKMADDISKDTKHTKKEVLTVMQQLTQFANIRSVNDIVGALSKHKISYIGNSSYCLEDSRHCYMPINSKEIHDVVHDRVGLHRALTYLVDNKHFGVLERVGRIKTAYFLDEQKVSQLERLKERDPEKFNHFTHLRSLKFFTLSGFDNGISFINRTKDLEKETRRVLKYSDKTGVSPENAVDAPIMTRIKALGVEPVVISRAGMPTEMCVYRQMAPEAMTESELINLIDANAQNRSDGLVSLLKIKDNSIKYLEDNLFILTPETMSKSMKNLHNQIIEHAQKRGFEQKDILYVEPEPVKSNALITYMFKKINDIPDDKFANLAEIMNGRVNPKDKLVVFVDDCTITGDSLKGAISSSRKVFGKNQPKLFACICGTSDAVRFFKKKDKSELIIDQYIRHVPTRKKHISSIKLDNAIGGPDYDQGEATCLILPYMSPDNNTEFASNIALLHNPTYRISNPLVGRYLRDGHKKLSEPDAYVQMETLRHEGIKNYTGLVDKVAKDAYKLSGSEPVILDKSLKTIQKENPKKFSDYFKLSTLEELIEEFLLP